MSVKRGGRWYKVVRREGDEVMVCGTVPYYPDFYRFILMWWELRYCEEVRV